MNYTIRIAETKDAQAVHDIYGFYTKGGNVTFTEVNPSVEEYEKKIARTKEKYPFYVAEDENGKILGYIHGSPLRPHDAYKWNVETTIMLAPDAPKRKGIGSSLYKKFMETLTKQGFMFVYGVLVDTNEESLKLHEALGFREVGHFSEAGYKSGKWRGITWMQKQIGDLSKAPTDPIPFNSLE